MIRRAALALAVAGLGCGGASSSAPTPLRTGGAELGAAAAPATAGERMLAMLPQGAQVVIEVDLARLRANAVIGAVVTRALALGAAPALRAAGADDLAGPGSPLAVADAIVLAAYGVGTAHAASVTLLAAPGEVAGAVRVSGSAAAGVWALGPEAWTAQIAERAALLDTAPAGAAAIRAQPELLALRARAVPPGAPGAAVRLTARLPFDARVALARQTGLEAAPAQLSLWGDVVDDLVVVVEADGTDPGERRGQRAAARIEGALRAALAALASEPAVRALGLAPSLERARLRARGSWVRAVVAVGPTHLRRVAARAEALVPAGPAGAAPPATPPGAPDAAPAASAAGGGAAAAPAARGGGRVGQGSGVPPAERARAASCDPSHLEDCHEADR